MDYIMNNVEFPTNAASSETGIKACPAVPACFHEDYQWNRIRRVEHGGHQFHYGIGLHAPVGFLQSHAYRLALIAW
ncbi:hypothetical protein T12_1160 [Trichinella patagoniensis]|uniref:Uncharacterized protein n=1 Tax=Trichinella patagoniensis TaxID=990121 RepID=A0A0V0ZI21_9BILA|nr:hypothetical protein T12_1160 [Trichinella patagoniensis]